MSRSSKRFRDAKDKREAGGFAPLPFVVLRSQSFARLTPYAAKLFLDMLAQYRGNNNGDLSARWSLMKQRGWRSPSTLNKAKRELIAKEWILIARMGGMNNRPHLYALTCYAIDECNGKLDIGATHSPPSVWKRHEPISEAMKQIQTAAKKQIATTRGESAER